MKISRKKKVQYIEFIVQNMWKMFYFDNQMTCFITLTAVSSEAFKVPTRLGYFWIVWWNTQARCDIKMLYGVQIKHDRLQQLQYAFELYDK